LLQKKKNPQIDRYKLEIDKSVDFVNNLQNTKETHPLFSVTNIPVGVYSIKIRVFANYSMKYDSRMTNVQDR
jgi:hypothetical protein